MEQEEKAINGRIRALMDRNKQINTELENNTPEAKKEVLNTEKMTNNDKLRQERSRRFRIRQDNSDTEFMKECCRYLQSLKLVRSQHDFCVGFLNKSKHYLSVILCEHRRPSVNILHTLVYNLKQAKSVYDEYEFKEETVEKLNKLIDKGTTLINKRIQKQFPTLLCR